ncbi:hypothetical protein Q9233_017065, partial [Columba guinea]
RIDKLVDKWSGSIEIGGVATTLTPQVVYGVVDLYGMAVKAGDTVGVLRRDDGTLHFFVNGVAQGPAAWNVPPNVFAVVDLYGQAAQATILEEGGDLRFHRRHGSNAIVTNGGRTALRQNCRSEFNDAIVISNRGTAIMQDGNTMRNNYGCDLDALGTGSRIGMMRTARGDLRYFINGSDQGVACSGLPPEVYAVVDLYGQCVQVSLTGATGPVDNSQAPATVTEKPCPLPSP